MRELAITILSSLLFFLILLFAFIGFQNNTKRLPFYHYPSGLIVNIGEGNRAHWGNSVIQEDLEKFESIADFSDTDSIRLHIKDTNGNIYEEVFKLTTIRKTDVLGVFFSDLFLAFFSLAIAVYFYYSTRDALIFGFFFNFGLIILSNVFVLTFKNFGFSFCSHTLFRKFSTVPPNLQTSWKGNQFQVAATPSINILYHGHDRLTRKVRYDTDRKSCISCPRNHSFIWFHQYYSQYL